MNKIISPSELLSIERQKENEAYVERNTSFLYTSGSRLYGTNVLSSDTDVRGVFIHDQSKIFSILKIDDLTDLKFTDNEDKVLFELKTFATMIYEQKPNAIEALWIEDKDIILNSDLLDTLRENKHELTSKLSLDKMLGFSASQLKMAKRFEQKHFEKEMIEPKRENYIKVISATNNNWGHLGFPIKNTFAVRDGELIKLYSANILDNSEHSWISANRLLFINNRDVSNLEILATVEFNNELFKKDVLSYKNFQKWKESGNMNKMDIAESIGYQPKAMMHALRNLYMAKDFIETGSILLHRKENEFLKTIREGRLSLKECESLYEDLNNEIKNKQINFSLPEVNENLLNEIVRDTYSNKLNIKNDMKRGRKL